MPEQNLEKSQVKNDSKESQAEQVRDTARNALISEAYKSVNQLVPASDSITDTPVRKAAVVGKAVAGAVPEGVAHAILGVDHVSVPFSKMLGNEVTLPVPVIAENVAVSAAIGFAARTLLPETGVLGKVGSAVLATTFAAPLAGASYKMANELYYAKTAAELQNAGHDLGVALGGLAVNVPVGMYSYKFGSNIGGKVLTTEAAAPFARARVQFYDSMNQKLAAGIDATADSLKSAFGIKQDYTGSHSVAETYERIPQSLVEKLKGDDYKLPTEKLEPGTGKGAKVLIVTGHGVEAPEFTEVYRALKESGADVKVATPDWMWDYQQPKGSFSLAQWMENQHIASADLRISEGINLLKQGDLDAVYVPGGAGNTAALRTDSGAQQIIRQAHELGKDIWTICHGGQVLISSEAFPKGTVLTGSPDIRPQDLPNAGFTVPKEQVAYDTTQHLLSGQDPNALNPFIVGIGERLKAIVAGKGTAK